MQDRIIPANAGALEHIRRWAQRAVTRIHRADKAQRKQIEAGRAHDYEDRACEFERICYGQKVEAVRAIEVFTGAVDALLEMEANPHGGTYATLCAQYKRVRDAREKLGKVEDHA